MVAQANKEIKHLQVKFVTRVDYLFIGNEWISPNIFQFCYFLATNTAYCSKQESSRCIHINWTTEKSSFIERYKITDCKVGALIGPTSHLRCHFIMWRNYQLHLMKQISTPQTPPKLFKNSRIFPQTVTYKTIIDASVKRLPTWILASIVVCLLLLISLLLFLLFPWYCTFFESFLKRWVKPL